MTGDWWSQNGPQLATGITSGGTAVYRPTTTTSTVGSGDRLVPLNGNTGVTGGLPRPTSTTAQDPRAFLQSLAAGGTLTPQQLTAAIPQLQQMGVRVLGANSEGIQSKIQLPNGQIVDLIKDAGGQNGFQWLTDSGGGSGAGSMSLGGMMSGGLPAGYWTGQQTGGGQYPLASAGGPGLAQPWTTPFNSPGDFQSPGDFTPPNVTDDPGFQFRMQEGQKALERSAAAKGTLLTGGLLKDLAQYSQGLASQEYGNAYNRALGQNELAYGRAWNENNLDYGRAMDEYRMAHDIYNSNNTNLYNRLSGLAGLGQTGVGQLGTGNYANSASNLITGAGNAQAAGTVGSANAWGGALSGIANSTPLWMQMIQQNQMNSWRPPVMSPQATSSYPGTYYGAGTFNV